MNILVPPLDLPNTGDGRSSSCYLNDDLLIEILSRLPPEISTQIHVRVQIMAQFDLQHSFFASFGPCFWHLISHNSMSGPWDEKKGYIDLSDACSSNCRDAVEPWSSNKDCMELIESWTACLTTSDVYCESIFRVHYHICNPATNQCFALPEPETPILTFHPLVQIGFWPQLVPSLQGCPILWKSLL